MAFLFALVLIGAAEQPSATAALPDELAGLPALLNDEQRLVDTVRRFDLLQQALADWDLAMAEDLGKAGDGRLAEMKQRQAADRYALVRRAYELALQHYRTNAQATNYYAELLYDKFGETAYAVRLWNLAKAIDPTLSQPFNNLAIHFCHVGDYKVGLDCLLTAVKLEPDNPDYLFNLAQTYLVHGPQVQALLNWDKPRVYREAMKASEKAARQAPNDFALLKDYAMNFFLAENFDVQPDWRAAAKAWETARACAPNKAKAFNTWLNEARVWLRYPDKAKALACLQRALAIWPESDVARGLVEEIKQDPDLAR